MAQIKTWIVPGLTSGARRVWLTKYRMRFNKLQSDLLIAVAELKSEGDLNGCASIEVKHRNSRLRATVYVENDASSVWIWRFRFSSRLGWLPEDDDRPSGPDDSEPDGTFELHPLAHGWELSQVDGCEPYVYPGPVHSKTAGARMALEAAAASLRPIGFGGTAKSGVPPTRDAYAPDTVTATAVIPAGTTMRGDIVDGGASDTLSSNACSLNSIGSNCAVSITRKLEHTRSFSKSEMANTYYCECADKTPIRLAQPRAKNTIIERTLNATKRRSLTTMSNAKAFLKSRYQHFDSRVTGAINNIENAELRRRESGDAVPPATSIGPDDLFLLHMHDATGDARQLADAILRLSDFIYFNRHYITQHFPGREAAMLRMSDSEILKILKDMPSLPARSATTVRSALRRLNEASRKAARVRPGDVFGVNFAASHQPPTLQ